LLTSGGLSVGIVHSQTEATELLLLFIAKVTELVQFTECNTFLKIPPTTSMHFARIMKTWRVAHLYNDIAIRKPFGTGHMYVYV
jgi:hypothetical protein